LSHRGLGLPLYSQVTSPLRRYQDLLAHYQIRAFLAKKAGLPEADAMMLREEDVAQRCMLAAQASAQTRQAERDSRMHWVCVWLMKNPGWKGLATVMDAGNRDALLFVHDFGIELQMRTRRQLELDSTIFVRATRINIPNHDFTLEEAEPV
ncbi:MAG: RNB domain-containing ribonuclease, partial [Spirochaetia bacterium]|nr:RNB domain-containing ribonuclease [Spirochaetia bacterium]